MPRPRGPKQKTRRALEMFPEGQSDAGNRATLGTVESTVSDDSMRRVSTDAATSIPIAADMTAPLGHLSALVGQPVVCPLLVGRSGVMEALRRAMDAAGDGHGRIVLLSG